jgi:hypothetical protein
MTDAHIVNTIRMLRRNVENHRMRQCIAMGTYILGAPDGAAMACEKEREDLMDAEPGKVLRLCVLAYVHLLKEAKRRKLEI